MADAKLSALTELAATPAVDDEVYIRDVSEAAADESKRITMANLLAGVANYTEGARVYHSGNQTINNITWTSLTFDSERYDTDTIHDNVTNNHRLTCKTAGKYLIACTVEFDSNAVGLRQLVINFNGVSIAGQYMVPVNGGATVFGLATIYDLAVNEYVLVQVYQSSGGGLDIIAHGNFSAEFMMARIG